LSGSLDWLRTEAGWTVNSLGEPVILRGVAVVGASSPGTAATATLRDSLGLGDAALALLGTDWKINVIRVSVNPSVVLQGTGTVGPDVWVAQLDDLVTCAASSGCYTLLALDVQTPPSADQVSVSPMAAALVYLANRYQNEPAVLYELCQPDADYGPDWPRAAAVLIGLIRSQHPGSLLFVGGVDRPALTAAYPLRITPTDPFGHLVYTFGVSGTSSPLGTNSGLRGFLQIWPTFASKWLIGDTALGRLADIEATQLEQTATGWAAWSWDGDPGLVVDPKAGRFTPTRFGLAVKRALAEPRFSPAAVFTRR
jgi:hypothetical protein